MASTFQLPSWLQVFAGDPTSAGAAVGAAAANAQGAITNWLTGLGGDIASGLEAGFVAIFRDFWDVISGFVYIAIGVLIGMWAIAWYFRAAGTIAGIAATAAMR